MSQSVQRRDDLLCDRLLGVLTPEESLELEALLREHPIDDSELERLEEAAVVMTSALASTDPVPAGLLDRLNEDARVFSEQHRAQRDTTPVGERTLPSTATPPTPNATNATNVVRLRDRRVLIVAALGWAAAALLVIALGVERSKDPVVQVVTVSVSAPVPPPPVVPTLAEQREKLIADGATVTRIDWSGTKDPAASGVTGDVVWSTSSQRGFMRFRGLAVNDPKKLQYQLWIFDKAQDQKHPIDGGVFDIDLATGDVIVPITPKIRVQDATLFAITIEKPGGVVVSSRERLVLLAKVPAG